VDWMVEILLDHVKKILSVRDAVSPIAKKGDDDSMYYTPPEGLICLDEVQMALNMHQFNAQQAAAVDNHAAIEVSPDIVGQLREYVAIIAGSYKHNPFHNFSHACHVTMSVHKLLKRIVAPQISSEKYAMVRKEGGADELAKHLNEYSHGIMHDPLALFAITFSALIHDVDHQGISNVQLSKEQPDMAAKYRQKSVAEQNSVDIAWDVLMMEQFKGLRKCLFQTKEELFRFRQLIVNVVLATDIFDKELNDLRKHRWTQAFATVQPGNDVNDLRATIVIEHIIQASDVSHTMQHWHVYRKWNTLLFQEMYLAFKADRMGADPSGFWYQGELGFFDNYVIPLAKKLKECNVFGVSSDEYLNYAMMNRAEWEERGKEIVEELVVECQALVGK
jgi:3'5'-cyclic nucleotide phosphodiesterase